VFNIPKANGRLFPAHFQKTTNKHRSCLCHIKI